MLSRSTLFTGPGGDTAQMLETARALEPLGWKADVVAAGTPVRYADYELLHLFGVIRPADLLPAIRESGLPYVLSPVFMDYSGYEARHRGGPTGAVLRRLSPDGQEYLKALARVLRNGEPTGATDYWWRGHAASARQVISGARAVLPNSLSEQRRLEARYGVARPSYVVPNGVDAAAIAEAQSSPDARYQGAIVCAARIEGNKNQLALIRALRWLEVPLVFTGQPAPNHLSYAAHCRAEAGANVRFLGRLAEHVDVLRILAAARVHVLPSHFETCGLSSLEAAALGTRIVVGDRGDVRDYFGSAAVYCDPDDEASIRAAVLEAMATSAPTGFADEVLTRYTWAAAAQATAGAYAAVLG